MVRSHLAAKIALIIGLVAVLITAIEVASTGFDTGRLVLLIIGLALSVMSFVVLLRQSHLARGQLARGRTEEADRLSRIEYLEIVLLAHDHAPALFRAAARAEHRDDLVEIIAETLNVTPSWAEVVRGMNLERLATAYERERIVEELQETRQLL